MAKFVEAIRVRDDKKVSFNVENIIFISEFEVDKTRIYFNASDNDGVKILTIKSGYDETKALINKS